MRVFLAYPFTQLLDPIEGVVCGPHQDMIRQVIQCLRSAGCSVFSAQEREAFGADLMPPDVCTRLDLREMREADVVVAFPGENPISGGVHIELGWASAFGKPIVLVLRRDASYSPLLVGLDTVASVSKITHDGIADSTTLDQILRAVQLHESALEAVACASF
jgi:nucleoside 2-deoxyribosyltransferase